MQFLINADTNAARVIVLENNFFLFIRKFRYALNNNFSTLFITIDLS